MESKQYRVKIVFTEDIKKKKWEIKKEVEKEITDNDIINSLCHKYLDKLGTEDIKAYRCEVLGDCEDWK